MQKFACEKLMTSFCWKRDLNLGAHPKRFYEANILPLSQPAPAQHLWNTNSSEEPKNKYRQHHLEDTPLNLRKVNLVSTQLCTLLYTQQTYSQDTSQHQHTSGMSYASASLKAPVQGITLRNVQSLLTVSNNPTTRTCLRGRQIKECVFIKDSCNSRKVKKLNVAKAGWLIRRVITL